MKSNKMYACIFLFALFFSCFTVSAQSFPNGSTSGTTELSRGVQGLNVPNIDINITQPQTGKEVAFSVQVLLLLTILTLAPSILLLVTCFLRFSIVLDFIKRALSLQQVPPTAVLNGIAFFMTIFVMWPTFRQVYDNAYKPLSDGQIGIEEAYTKAEAPFYVQANVERRELYTALYVDGAIRKAADAF